MSLIEAKSELTALWSLLKTILTEGVAVGNYLEVSNILLQIEYSSGEWDKFCAFRDRYLDVAKPFAQSGWSRATRVYTQTKDRPTKPSYRKRLVDFPDRPKRDLSCTSINQLDRISTLLASKPGYSNLSFVFLRPADLHDQFRFNSCCGFRYFSMEIHIMTHNNQFLRLVLCLSCIPYRNKIIAVIDE